MSMPVHFKIPGLVAFALLAVALVHPDDALARDRGAARHTEAGTGVSLDDAVRQVQRDTGGRVLSADPADGGYRIKVLLPSGHVRVIFVDAQSGARR